MIDLFIVDFVNFYTNEVITRILIFMKRVLSDLGK